MKNAILLVGCALLTLIFSSCNTAEKYAANQAATDNWLAASKGSAGITVGGVWEPEEVGWGGNAVLEQRGNQVRGKVGNYTVLGVINGSKLYMALISDDWTYYTAILTKKGSKLTGYYSSQVPFSPVEQWAFNLNRI